MSDLRADLVAAGQNATPALMDAIVAEADNAVPWLLRLVDEAVDEALNAPEEDSEDEELDEGDEDDELEGEEDDAEADADVPPEAWAPIHAAVLLRKIGHLDAVPVLLRAYLVTARNDALNYAARQALMGWKEAVQPIINLAASTEDDDVLDDLFELLATLEVRDDKIFDVFADDLTVNPGAARFIGLYGDKRGLPLVSKALDATPIVTSDVASNAPLFEMADAIMELGGSLSESQRQKLARVQALSDKPAPRVAVAEKTPGPNEPCHCGSGKKYKKCHGAV